LEGKVIEEIRDFLEWGGGNLGGDHQFGVVGLTATVLILAAVFFFDFPAASLAAAVDFGSGCLGASVTGAGFGVGVEWWLP
jgi:hypothetical protein